MLKWLKDELTNTSILVNLDKACEVAMSAMIDELGLKLQPAVLGCLEVMQHLEGLLRAKQIFGKNSVSSLGFQLGSLQDVCRAL